MISPGHDPRETGAAKTNPGGTSPLGALLKAEYRAIRNRFVLAEPEAKRFRLMLFLIGILVVLLIFSGSRRAFDHILHHLTMTPELGLPLTIRLMEMAHLLFFVMLLISSLSVTLSVFYLDGEISFLVTTPLSRVGLMLARSILCHIRSAWFVVFAAAPLLLGWAVAADEPSSMPLRFIAAIGVTALFTIAPVMLGVSAAIVIVRFIPARQAKSVLMILSVVALSMTIVGLRWMTPERFLRPRIDPNLGVTLAAIAEPASPWLPSGWAAEAIVLMDSAAAGKLLLFAAAAFALAQAAAALFHRAGFDRVASERPAAVKVLRPHPADVIASLMPRETSLIVRKDLRLFWRDPTQWSQLIILLALIVIYVFNFRQFQGEITTIFLRDVISFLNLGMAGFVLVAVANRFVFSAIALEGRTIWLIRSSPFPIRRLMLAKVLVAAPPLLLLAEIITLLANHAIGVSAAFAVSAALTVLLMTISLSIMAVGLGAFSPRFDLQDPAQIGMSPEGILYMGAGIAYVGVTVFALASGLLDHFIRRYTGDGVSLLPPLIMLATSLCAIILPWRIGIRKIESLELKG